jgi:hypothetical protein
MLSDSTHEATNQAVVGIANMPLEQGQPVSKLANELPTFVDDLGGSIERRFMADCRLMRMAEATDPIFSEQLFSYGTLQLEAVQLSTFGRKLDGQADEMPRFAVTMLRSKTRTLWQRAENSPPGGHLQRQRRRQGERHCLCNHP